MSTSTDSRGMNFDRSAFITGSAGFAGKHLVKALARSGHSIVAVYRSRMPESLQNVFPVCSDLSNIDMLKIPLRGINTVVHLAWDESFCQEAPPELGESFYNSRNIKSLRNLIQAMEAAKSHRLIFVSVAGANPQDPSYFKREKYWAEHLIINSSIPEKIIVRAPMIIGPMESGYFLYRSVKDALRIPFLAPTPTYKRSIKPIHIDDFVASLNMLITKPLVQPCLISDIEGQESFSSEELLRLIQLQVDSGMRLRVRGRLANFLLGLTELGRRGRPQRPLLSQCLDSVFQDETQSPMGNIISRMLNQHSFTSIKPNIDRASA